MTRKVTAAAVSILSGGMLLSPVGISSASAATFSCAGYNTNPSTYYGSEPGQRFIVGVTEQICSGSYVNQRLDIELQRKRVLKFLPDQWYTLASAAGGTTSSSYARLQITRQCSDGSDRIWRVHGKGSAVNGTQHGDGYSDEAKLPCGGIA